MDTSTDQLENGVLNVGGFSLPYRIEGRGPAVIVIGDTHYYPRTFSAALRQRLRLIFTCHRGFGRATQPFTNADFELDVLADDIETLRRELDLERLIVLGHSGHGHMALTYAKCYPQHVAGVVVLAMSPDSSPASFAAADRYLEESVCPERKKALADSMAQLEADIQADPDRRFIHYSLRSGPRIWFDHSFDAAPLWRDVEVIPQMFDYVWGTLLPRAEIGAGLDRLTMPVFLGLGRYDYWNPPHLWEPARGQFGDLRVRVFEHSGHTPQLEEPAHFDRELLEWIDQL